MNSFPANERTLSEFERGWSCSAVVPVPTGLSVSVGDSILFALAQSRADREPAYVKGGDSIRVQLTDVTDLKSNDPTTGLPLFQISWAPLGSTSLPSRSR